MVALDRIPIAAKQDCIVGLPEAGETAWFPGRVLEREHDLVWIELDPDHLPALDAEVVVEVWRAGDARYSLRTQVKKIKSYESGVFGVWILACDRVQRRRYFRVPVILAVDDARALGAEGAEEQLTMHISDISAGGIKATITVSHSHSGADEPPIALGSEMQVSLHLPGESEGFSLRARIVRVGQEQPASRIGRGDRVGIGAVFVEVAQPVQERLIHAVLRVQHLHARRGLL